MTSSNPDQNLILVAKKIWFENELKENEHIHLEDFRNIIRIYESLLKSPNRKIPLACGDAGSYMDAKSIWDEVFKPSYSYGSEELKACDQRDHELGIAGHGAGSTTVLGNKAKRKRVIKAEELTNILDIQNARLKEFKA